MATNARIVNNHLVVAVCSLLALCFIFAAFRYSDTAAAAETSAAASGQMTTEVNAALEQGGEIGGTVTDASTGKPIAFIGACAYAFPGLSTDQAPCGITNRNGVYTISHLLGGNYAVAFGDLYGRYRPQFYNDMPTLGSANPVGVAPPNLTAGIDAALQRVRAGAPATTGGPPLSPGGPPLSPTTGNSEADRSPPAMGFAVLIRSTRVTVRRAVALVHLKCHLTCRGKLTLLATGSIRHGRKRIAHTVSLGSALFAATAERAATVKIKLNAVGRGLLKHEHGRLACRLMISQVTPGPRRTKVVNIHLIA